MAAFAPANAALAAAEGSRAVRAPTPTPPTTPTTPTPATRTAQPPRDGSHDASSSPGTPTRHSFGGVLGQRPLPAGPPTAPAALPAPPAPPAVRRDGSHRSQKAEDVEMGEAGHDDEPDADDDGDSDNESAKSESQRSGSKKKKGQRFFCTDFPPCQLSFTRSEHLARHIRKHTGERPFQCHCSRRFSRLDNLRQHAQTVHVNEEIPAESLAATSTRFQRQIRTDRVRPPNNRSRASTLGSNGGGAAGGGGGGGGGGHSRGHSRNLSASSVGSAVSSMGGMPDDARRRPPPPLAMANDPAARARLSLENYGAVTGSPGPQYMYYNSSPAGYSTRTSTAYSTGGQHSPRFQSGVVSPVSTISRSSFYNGSRASGRRLSVPSGANPFQQQNSTYALPYFSPLPSGQSATFSQSGSIHGSPTSSMYSHGRRESESEMEYRRRTWHPTTNSQYQQRPATSGLTYHQTPDEPRPAFIQQQAASQMTRLPGIESFDHAPPPSSTRQPDPVMIESSPRPTSSGRELQQGLTRLDIAAANAPVEGQWQVQQVPPPQPAGYYPQAPPHPYVHPKHMSMPEGPVTSRKYKRNAWYGGPVTPRECGASGGMYMPHRPSPEDSGSSDGVPTPSTSQGAEYNPVIVNPGMPAEHHYSPGTAITTDEQKAYCDPNQSNHVQHKEDRMRTDSGYHSYVQQPPQQQAQPPQTYALQNGHDPRFAQADYGQPPNNDMAKLEALVAVATSEGHRAEHRS